MDSTNKLNECNAQFPRFLFLSIITYLRQREVIFSPFKDVHSIKARHDYAARFPQ